MARLIWTEPALTDLDEIAEYIALDNISAAKKLVRKVFQKVERLERHPLSGRKPPELKKTSYRKVIVDPCRIFYRIDNKDIYIPRSSSKHWIKYFRTRLNIVYT